MNLKTWSTKSGLRIMRVLSGRSNVFLVTNGDLNLLVDTGPEFMRRVLERELNKLGITRIDYLILTHTHFDHAANAHFIKKNYNTGIIVHKSELDYLIAGENVRIKGTNFLSAFLVNHFGDWFFKKVRYEPCQYDILIDSFYDLNMFGINANIIHTPGHTCGSISVIIDNEIALVGDAMFGVFKGSIFCPFANDTELLVESWGKLLETGCSFFISGHGWGSSRKLVQREYERRKK